MNLFVGPDEIDSVKLSASNSADPSVSDTRIVWQAANSSFVAAVSSLQTREQREWESRDNSASWSTLNAFQIVFLVAVDLDDSLGRIPAYCKVNGETYFGTDIEHFRRYTCWACPKRER